MKMNSAFQKMWLIPLNKGGNYFFTQGYVSLGGCIYSYFYSFCREKIQCFFTALYFSCFRTAQDVNNVVNQTHLTAVNIYFEEDDLWVFVTQHVESWSYSDAWPAPEEEGQSRLAVNSSLTMDQCINCCSTCPARCDENLPHTITLLSEANTSLTYSFIYYNIIKTFSRM